MNQRTLSNLPTIWRIPDELWPFCEALIDELDPPNPTGRPRKPSRPILDGILYPLRTGCQWNQLPRDFGDDSTVHRRFQRWESLGLWDRLWAALVEHCDALGAVHWRWQAADGALYKTRHGGALVGKNPTDRGKRGTKRSLLVEQQGGPLAVVIDGANVHDTRRRTLEAIIVERPCPIFVEQHLCLDKAYDNPTGHLSARAAGYRAHIRCIGESAFPKTHRRHPPRRWVVERTLAWLSKCRALLVRYEKNPQSFLALLKLACALIWFRRCWRLAHAR